MVIGDTNMDHEIHASVYDPDSEQFPALLTHFLPDSGRLRGWARSGNWSTWLRNLIGVTEPKKLPPDALRNLFQVVLCVGVLAFTTNAQGANWYVRPSSQGSANGTNWLNAWSVTNLNTFWSIVQPGDTIWLAGGNYSGSITFTKNGAAGNYIYVKRATTSDPEATGAPGWVAAFDSQVIFGPTGSTPLKWDNVAGLGSYVYVDGRTSNGISCRYDNSANAFSGAARWTGGGQHDIVLADLDLAGPGGASPFNYQGDNAPLLMRSAAGPIYNITVSRCNVMVDRICYIVIPMAVTTILPLSIRAFTTIPHRTATSTPICSTMKRGTTGQFVTTTLVDGRSRGSYFGMWGLAPSTTSMGISSIIPPRVLRLVFGRGAMLDQMTLEVSLTTIRSSECLLRVANPGRGDLVRARWLGTTSTGTPVGARQLEDLRFGLQFCQQLNSGCA